MRKYYTRACNFYYGEKAKKLILNKKALSLNSRMDIAFDQLEIVERKKDRIVENKIYPIDRLEKIDDKESLSKIKNDLKNIISERKNILDLKLNIPHIMGVLNITPDSFSDGGLFIEEKEAYDHAKLMINNGATIIDIGGESTRPGSKTIDEKEEWIRINNTIIKLKKDFPKIHLQENLM